jgi:hypothetical protein
MSLDHLIPFEKVITIYCENHTQDIDVLCGQMLKFLMSNHCALKLEAEIHFLLGVCYLVLSINFCSFWYI